MVVSEICCNFAPAIQESWQSDRSRWTRNPVYPFGYRGFESLTLRLSAKMGTSRVPIFSIWQSASYAYKSLKQRLIRGRSSLKILMESCNVLIGLAAQRYYKKNYTPHVNKQCVILLNVINMRTTPNVELIYNRRHTATTTKEAAVELRVSFRKQQKYMATGIKLLPKHWHRGRVSACVFFRIIF